MKKRFNILTLIVSVTLSAIVSFQITYVYCARRQLIELDKEAGYDREKLAYVDEMYRKYFVGEMDEEALTDAVIRGYLSGAGERFGMYLTEDEYAARMDSMAGEMVGIGVTVVFEEELGLVRVVSVMTDSPAQKAGVQPGDMIVAVGDEDALTLGYEGVLERVVGVEGTAVTVTVSRPSEDGAEHEFTMKRERITEQSVYYNMCENGTTGLVRITGFNSGTPKQFTDAVEALKAEGMTEVVFDLRDNPGGELNSVVSVLDYILPEGDIIVAIDREGNKNVMGKSAQSELDMPMAVLINENSASAAELFAGCIRDYEKGPLIGATSFGKGSMQTLMELPDGSAVSITYRKFTSASGWSHDGVGFTPDIEASLPEEYQDVSLFLLTEEQDTVLGEAIKYLNGLNADN